MKHQFYPQKNIQNRFIQKLLSSFKFSSILLISFSWLNSNAQTITGVTGQSTVCLGSQASISFTVTNGTGSSNYFTANTTFTIYYRKGTTGSFANLTTFKTTAAPTGGDGASAVINYTLNVPPLATVGSYQISIGSTLPTFVGSGGINASPAFSIINNSTTATFNKVFASSCNGGNDGSINVTPSGGASPYTYSWTGVSGFTATTPNVSGLSLGDYNVIVTDKNLCATTLTGITIKQAPAVQVGYSKTIPTCAGNDGALNVYRIGGVYDGINPIQYKVEGTATFPYQNSGSFTGLIAGDYIVTAKDSKGCTGTALVNLPADTRPAPTAGILQKVLPSCGQTNGLISVFRIGGVDGNNPIQFKLDGDATIPYQNNNVFSGLASGNYFVTVKDARGCTGTLAVSLPEDTRPAPTVGIYQHSNPGCSGNDGTINAFRIGGTDDGGSPIQFKLDGSATVPYQSGGVFNNLSAGNYTVTVKDSRGCTSSSPVVLTQAGPLSFMPNSYNTNVSSCGGGSDGAIVVAISGGVAPYHYILDGVEKQVSSLTTGGFGGLQPNISYKVTVTDSKGCSISKNVTLNQASTPTAIIAYRGDVTCVGGNNGFITVGYNAGGVPGYTYSKDGGLTYQDSYRITDLTAGGYSIIVKDSKGCVSAPVPVTIADGTATCMAGRVGNTANTNIENRSGISDENSSFSKTSLDYALSVQAYPNPSPSEFTLDVKGNAQENVSIVVTDILGRRIYQAKGNANMQYKFGSDLKHGIYIVQVIQGNNVQTIKIVKE